MSDLTVAASEATFRELFENARDNFSWAGADYGSWANLYAGYDIELHLENGTVDLRDDNTISIKELDIKWDKLDITLGFDLPRWCVGGFCVVPDLIFGGCLVRAPRVCLFTSAPDVEVTLPLGGLTSEVSIIASPETKYVVDSARPAGETDVEARNNDRPNKWQILLDFGADGVDLDPIDFPETIEDLLLDEVRDFLYAVFPDWAVDLALAPFDGIMDLIELAVDLPDDLGEWLADLLDFDFNVFNLIASAIVDGLAEDNPLHELEDPFPVPIEGGTPPVPTDPGDPIPFLVPIRDLRVHVTDVEMVVEADVGPA